MPATLSRQQLLSLARQGAAARIQEIQAEMAAIRAQFADVEAGGGRHPIPRKRRRRKLGKLSAAGRKAIVTAQKARWAKLRAAKGGRKRKGMSAAARKAVGDRMRKYWAAKRAEKKAKK